MPFRSDKQKNGCTLINQRLQKNGQKDMEVK